MLEHERPKRSFLQNAGLSGLVVTGGLMVPFEGGLMRRVITLKHGNLVRCLGFSGHLGHSTPPARATGIAQPADDERLDRIDDFRSGRPCEGIRE